MGVCVAGGVHGRGYAWQGGMCAGDTATEVGSTHLTGMLSCHTFIFQLTEKFETMTFPEILIHHNCILSHLHEWYPMSTMTHSHSPF